MITEPRTDLRTLGEAGAVFADIYQGSEFEGTMEMLGKVIAVNGDQLTLNFGNFQRDVDVSKVPVEWGGAGPGQLIRKFGPGCGINFQIGDGALIWVDVGLSGDELRNIWNSAPNGEALTETIVQMLTGIPNWKVVFVTAGL